MSKFRWISYIALRYVSRSRRNSPSNVFSILGIATGVLALIVIIAVMNGFQLGFIESILEISSCHLRLENIAPSGKQEIIDRLRSLPEVLSVLPFEESNVLLRGRHSSPRGVLIRSIPANALGLDPGLAGKLEIEDGFFDIAQPYSIVLGAELARHLLVRTGDEVNLLSLTFQDDDEGSRLYKVTGIFRSGYYEYDLGWAFMGMEPGADSAILGIKLKNRWQDQWAMEEIRKLLALSGMEEGDYSLSSWRDYNSAFFGALRTEKLMMFILVGLIFIVVGLNIFQAQRRTVLERREEIGLLRALGASDTAVRLVFVLDGFIIGLAGAGLGLVFGLLISSNIQAFFSLLEGAVNVLIMAANFLLGIITGGMGNQVQEFALFSPQVFYIKGIPSQVIPYEAALIFLFGFSSAIMAAWFASGKVSGTRPAEVLRYE